VPVSSTIQPGATSTTLSVGNSTITRTGTGSGPTTITGVGLLLVGTLLAFAGRRRASDGNHFA
jgi:hypothetical protein